MRYFLFPAESIRRQISSLLDRYYAGRHIFAFHARCSSHSAILFRFPRFVDILFVINSGLVCRFGDIYVDAGEAAQKFAIRCAAKEFGRKRDYGWRPRVHLASDTPSLFPQLHAQFGKDGFSLTEDTVMCPRDAERFVMSGVEFFMLTFADDIVCTQRSAFSGIAAGISGISPVTYMRGLCVRVNHAEDLYLAWGTDLDTLKGKCFEQVRAEALGFRQICADPVYEQQNPGALRQAFDPFLAC